MIQVALNAVSKALLKGKQRDYTQRESWWGKQRWGDVATSHTTLQAPEAGEAGTFPPRALGVGRTLLTP